MTLDSAKSRRAAKPALFAKLDMAIIQAGVDTDADTVYAMSDWSMRQGRRLPWYAQWEKTIIADEGGHDAVLFAVAGLALALARDEGIPFQDAAFKAGATWRDGCRRQWGDVGRWRDSWQQPLVFGGLPAGSRPVEDWLDEHIVEMAPTPEFDPDNIEDPRLARIWAGLPEIDRSTLSLMAEGVGRDHAAELAGVSSSAEWKRRKRAVKHARALAAAV